jgi:transposase
MTATAVRVSPKSGLTRVETLAWIRALVADGWTHRQVAEELCISANSVKNLLYDPDGAKQRARRRRYQGKCEVCGKPTDGSNGRAAAPKLCAAHSLEKQHEERQWTRSRIIASFWAFEAIMGRQPTAGDILGSAPSYQAHYSTCRVAEIGRARVRGAVLPHPGFVYREFGSWAAALEAAGMSPNPRGAAAHRECL